VKDKMEAGYFWYLICQATCQKSESKHEIDGGSVAILQTWVGGDFGYG
jgi:hypothetical protein